MPEIKYNRPGRRNYISIHKHQRTSGSRFSKWLSIDIEKRTFDNADYGNFTHLPGGIAWLDGSVLWGFLINQQVLGMGGEQFGYFIGQVNPALEWHGYPVIPFSIPRFNISTILIERWVREGVLDQDDVPALMNKKRI